MMECQSNRAEISEPDGKKMKPSEHTEYDLLIYQLADQYGIAHHPDPLVILKAIRLLTEKLYAADGVCLGNQPSFENHMQDEQINQQSKFTLQDISLPTVVSTKFDKSRENIDDRMMFEQAAKSLKLLYLDDQKRLQSKVNEIVSSIQSVTANPKTDSRALASGRK